MRAIRGWPFVDGTNYSIPTTQFPCGILTLTFGEAELRRIGMPYELSAIASNFAATARSHHSGLVNILRLDGSVEAVANQVESIVWLKLHSRDSKLAEEIHEVAHP